MNKNVYNKEEFIELLDLSSEDLDNWEKLGLIRHPGKIDAQIPYYTDTNVREVKHILQLLKFGYDIESIQKIVRKVGLPETIAGKKTKGKATEFITVGELAGQAELNTRTIKYWEERGIIQPEGRSPGGYRLYSRAYIDICNLIKDLQNFGYSLEQIKEASDLFRDFLAISRGVSGLSRDEAKKRLELLQSKIKELNERMKGLKQGIQRWEDLIKKKKKEISHVLEKSIQPGKKKNKNVQVSAQKTTA
jgi:DNA-binding transcriptional MerR regulator